jgi:nitrous oxidase accessory protein
MTWLRRGLGGQLAALALVLTQTACLPSSREGTVTLWTPAPAPARPAGCEELASTKSLRAALARQQGGALCLAPGSYQGPFTLQGPVTVWGPPQAVLRSTGRGTTVQLAGSGPALLGVTVDGSGGRFDTLDAAVRVEAQDARVQGVRILNATFGILSEKSARVALVDNHISGDATSPVGMRGDGIRLWETQDSTVAGNLVEDSRDMVVWYSSDNTLRGNFVRRGRYGTHFMYSHRNVVEDNRYIGNQVGVFVMYSREIRLARNLLADASGAAGMGIGLKESGNVTVVENSVLHNTIGVYLDTSPQHLEEVNRFERNVFRLSEAGVVFHSSQKGNTFVGNSLRDNYNQVRVEGGGDALGTLWEGNDFDDYQGFDLDRDGTGDVPYELRSLSNELVSRYPDLSFFRGAAALGLVAAAGEMIPLMAPKTILRDEAPRMGALELEVSFAR